MATFVLVHGGWSGAHGFRPVCVGLQAARHAVFTPSLTGIGERVHLTSPQVDFTTHISDLVAQILDERLDHIVLLGFSYGGFVITGSLAYITDPVPHLIYLARLSPMTATRSSGSRAARPPIVRARRRSHSAKRGSCRDLRTSSTTRTRPRSQTARRTPHPLRCLTEPGTVDRPLEAFPFSRSYIRATADAADAPGTVAFEAAASRARESDAWHYHEIATRHMVASNQPDALVELLLGLV